MGLTADQKIPEQKKPQSEWTMRALFPAKAAANAVARIFTSAFELLLAVSVIIAGIAELLNRSVSPFFYVLIFFLVVGVACEHYFLLVNHSPNERQDKPRRRATSGENS